jgi:hypothetical protein
MGKMEYGIPEVQRKGVSAFQLQETLRFLRQGYHLGERLPNIYYIHEAESSNYGESCTHPNTSLEVGWW